jgi:hypothetical protein
MLIFFALLYMFYVLFGLINSNMCDERSAKFKLAQKLSAQKDGLTKMLWLVSVSYFLSSLIFYFYGNYRKVDIFTWFVRWLAYPIMAIIIELPNMMVIYYIHW